MNFTFCTDSAQIMNSVYLVRDFVNEGLSPQMYCNFPFTESDFLDEDTIKEKIEEDLSACSLDLVKNNLVEYLDQITGDVVLRITEYAKKENVVILEEYVCVLTPYGPFGYYNDTNTIFVNISKGSTEFTIETLLHEFLHLVLGEQLKNLEDAEVENKVDRVFVSLFGDMFPNYHIQKI